MGLTTGLPFCCAPGTQTLPPLRAIPLHNFLHLPPHSALCRCASRTVFELALERVRRDYQLSVYGYVVMPDHVHLLLSEPSRVTLAAAIKSLKQGVARRLLKEGEHFWQKRYYDHNIRTHSQFVEKLWYIHQNPVTAGLCRSAEDWPWSSFRHFATGEEGIVEIESEWTARKRERKAGTLAPAIALPHSSQPKA